VTDDDSGDGVGSVGEEAAKLMAAVQGWARENGSEYANAAADVASGGSSTIDSINEHIATGGEDCKYCPVCQVISAVRGTSPEVRQHLTSAATSFMHAVAGLLETHGPDQKHARPDPGVEKIDLSDDGGWDNNAWD